MKDFRSALRIALLGSVIFAHFATADGLSEYRALIGFDIRSSDSDSMETDSRKLRGKLFFSPVNTRNDYPMELQEYFNRSSSVYLSRTAATQESVINASSHHLGKGLTLASAQSPLVFSWSKLETQDADVNALVSFSGRQDAMADQAADTKSLGIYIDEFFVRFSRTELDSMLKYKYGESIHISGLSPIAGDHYYLQVDSRKTSDELAVMYTDRMSDGTYFSAGMSLVFSDINEEISDLNYFVPLMLGSDPDFPGALVNKVSVKRSSDEELWRYYATWYPNRYSYIKTEYSRGLNQGIALQGGAYLTYRMSVYASFVHGSGSHNPAKVTMAGLEYLF
ncbi:MULTISPECIES: hypothetical protein [unclassified Thalassolituus]|uniref:hypothetical protein n=1 Tax=Oceanospirillaceae TaxID=135620 RepID=UPI001191B4CF|nr:MULTISPECIES: hypothetical protein [unclassified Thalassolituus]TVV45404.1 hypothetical protein FOT50_00780 [Thalassolituus sp. C2-1]